MFHVAVHRYLMKSGSSVANRVLGARLGGAARHIGMALTRGARVSVPGLTFDVTFIVAGLTVGLGDTRPVLQHLCIHTNKHMFYS